jgi:hypothetical protein
MKNSISKGRHGKRDKFACRGGKSMLTLGQKISKRFHKGNLGKFKVALCLIEMK